MSDLTFQSTFLRTLRPRVLEPADGAVLTPPVQLRWEGPSQLAVALVAGAGRQDLGKHDSPFEVQAEHFPREGQYTFELRSPLPGPWSSTTRRFLVRMPEVVPSPTPCPDRQGEIDELTHLAERLESEKNGVTQEAVSLRQTIEQLRSENARLLAELEQRDDIESHLAVVEESSEAQRNELLREQQLLLEENRILRTRLDSVPPCTAWGYLTYPRPQAGPVPRRFVVVSDAQGNIFQNQVQCEIVRRSDRGGASPCLCVGQTWNR